MGEWTWLHTRFPLADIELISDPIDAKAANVIVRTIRCMPSQDAAGEAMYEVRVAPHNVAKFRGGPWLHIFRDSELQNPGAELFAFRAFLASEIRRAQGQSI